MAERIVLSWRNIPAQIVIKAGRKQARRELDPRFQEAIDRAAMRAGLYGTDDYLEQWARGQPEPCGDDLEAEADAAVQQIEAAYDAERLRALIASGGQDEDTDR